MADDKKVVSEDEIRAIEADIKAKAFEQDQAKKVEIEKLLDQAVAKGKDEALRLFEAEQDRRRAEEERIKLGERTKQLEDEYKRLQEATAKKLEEMSKQMEEKIQTIESRPKGISRNESPFVSPTPQSPIQGLSREDVKEIERASMEAFYAKLGRPAPY